MERREQARVIARSWIAHIEKTDWSKINLASVGIKTKPAPDWLGHKYVELVGKAAHRKRKIPKLKAEELYSDLGSNFLIGLIDMRRTSRAYDAAPKGERTEQVTRDAAEFMLLKTIGLVWYANQYLDIGVNLEPLLRLHNAISDVAQGSNNRLLVTGELADRLVDKRFSRSTRHGIEARAAGLVELLVRHGHAQTQLAAATLVAASLKRGGFLSPGRGGRSLPPDTIKRWHNHAKRILQLAELTSDEAWFSPAHDWDRSFHDTYLAMLMPYEPDMVEKKRRSFFPELAEFDPDRELTDLAKRCWEARTYD